MDPTLVKATADTVQTYMGVPNLPSLEALFTNKFVGSVKVDDAE